MTPEVRAIADRFIYEQATLRHMASITPDEAFGRTVPGHDWNVRQLFAHLASSPATYQQVVTRWLGGEQSLAGWDPDEINAATAATYSSASTEELLAVFDTSIDQLIAVLASIPDERLAEPLGPADASTTLGTFARHTLSHAITLLDALPEIRYDSLVLNWLLSATFKTAAEEEWQARLLEDAKAYIAAHIEDYEDEDEEE